MNYITRIGILAPLCFSAFGCASMSTVGYGDGNVTTSPVSYRYEAPPVLQDAQGQTYSVTGNAGFTTVSAFDRLGMQRSQGATDLVVAVQIGDMQRGEAGAMKTSRGYVPAFPVKVPYQIQVRHQGEVVLSRQETYSNLLTFKGSQAFPTKEQAVQAIETIARLAEKGLTKRAQTEAAQAARRTVDESAGQLCQKRRVSVEVPVVRSAAGIDTEHCYEQLANASDSLEVRAALESYTHLGTDQRNADGSPNDTANYGIACGIAAAKLMLGDGAGAWEACKQALSFEPNGQEAEKIQLVIYRQEVTTGVAVIPPAERARIDEAQRSANALQRMLASPGR